MGAGSTRTEKFRGAGRSPVERRAGAKKKADGVVMVVVASESSAQLQPALASPHRYSQPRRSTPSHSHRHQARAPALLPHQTQNPPPLASRNTRKGFERRDGRREGATLSCHFRTGGVRSPEPAGGVASSARRVAVNDEGEVCLAQLSSSFHVGKKKKYTA